MQLSKDSLKLLERLYNAAKPYNFKFGLTRSRIRINEMADFHLLYQQGYIYSKAARGNLFYIPTDKGKKAVLEKGQTQLFPIEGYYLFYLDPEYKRPYIFEKNGKKIQAKTTTLKAALSFKERAKHRNIDVYFKQGVPSSKRNPDEPAPFLPNEIALMTKEEYLAFMNPHDKYHPDTAYDFALHDLNRNYELQLVDEIRINNEEGFTVYKEGNNFVFRYKARVFSNDPSELGAILHEGTLYYSDPKIYQRLPSSYRPGGDRPTFGQEIPSIALPIKSVKRVKYLQEIIPLIDRVKERNLVKHPHLIQKWTSGGQDYEIRSEHEPIPDKGSTLVVLNDRGQIIAQASNEWGATLLAVAQEYRGKGIGRILGRVWSKYNPTFESGGFTTAGLATAKAMWQDRVEEFIKNQWYTDLISRGLLSVERHQKILSGLESKTPRTPISVKPAEEKTVLVYIEKDQGYWGPAFLIYDLAFFETPDEKYIYGFGFFRDSSVGSFLYSIDYERPFAKLTTYVALQIARNNQEKVYVGQGYGDFLELEGLEHIKIEGDYVSLTQDVINLEDLRRLERIIRQKNDSFDEKYNLLLEMAHSKWVY